MRMITVRSENFQWPASRRRERLRLSLVDMLKRARACWQIYARNRLAVVGLVLIVTYALMALSHPLLLGSVWPTGIYHPETGYDSKYVTRHPSPPSARHLFGTDTLGRDVLSRLLYATRPTFVLAITAALATALASILVGALAAYFRGWVDALLMQLAGAFLLLPAPIFMVVLAVWTGDFFGPAGFGAGYGLIAGLGPAAIIMRAHGRSLMSQPYIDAARVAGGGPVHIIRRHLVPQLLPLASIQMMVAVAGVVIADGFISWFGVGTYWNRLNWGSMVMWGISIINQEIVWHAMIPPALALSFFSAAFYLVSRGLQDVVDPRKRNTEPLL